MSRVKILCFGDSLTEGYSAWGQVFTPYARNMKAWLEAAWTSSTLSVIVDGVSGDQVLAHFYVGLKQSVNAKRTSAYEWIVILGGTNDLSYGRAAEEIFSELKKVYQVALDHGANVLALTVPEAFSGELSVETTKALNERRDTLNQMIMAHEAENYYALDLHSLLPNKQLPPEVREEMWDDGVHLTPYGYGVMGDHIANFLVSVWPTGEKKKKNNLQVGCDASEG